MPPLPPSEQSNLPMLIVGLGNPGPKYAGTRHNAGFLAVDQLARRHGLHFSGKQANAKVARGDIESTRVILAKPQTYMNDSGRAVGALARFYKVPPERVLVIHDELDLPTGTIRLREKGSAAGHNGLKSIIQHLGTQGFLRLRIGIDKPVVVGYDTIDWVLGRFTPDEQRSMEETLPRAAEAVEAILSIGMERAMNKYNAKEEQSRPPRGQARHNASQRITNVSTATGAAETQQSVEAKADKPSADKPESWVDKARRIIQEGAG